MLTPTQYKFQEIELAARALPVDTLQTLALIEDAPPGIAESTLALLGREAVDQLAERGVAECSDGTPRQITITPEGWELIGFCSDYVTPQKESEKDPNRWTAENRGAKLASAMKVLGCKSQ